MEDKKKPGRKRGSPNKVTVFSKIIITNILSDYHVSGLLEQDLAELDP